MIWLQDYMLTDGVLCLWVRPGDYRVMYTGDLCICLPQTATPDKWTNAKVFYKSCLLCEDMTWLTLGP